MNARGLATHLCFLAVSSALAIGFALVLASAQEPSLQEPARQASSEGIALRVLSYNIHHAEGVDGKLDVARIAGVIESVRPDIVALQEVDVKVKRSEQVDQAAELGRLTGMKHAFGGNIDLQGGKYGNALLTRGELSIVANHQLPNIDKGEQRGVLEAIVEHEGKKLRVFATHFDHRRDPRERLESASFVNQLADAQPQTPALLIGDLNASFDSDVLQRTTQVWQLCNKTSLPTIPVSQPERQIDFVLSFPRDAWEVVESRVLDEVVASDHRAIFYELKLKSGSK